VFTGLIEDVGTVAALEHGPDGASIEIETGLAGQIAVGDSIAVNGVCLTATVVGERSFTAQAMNETLRRSSLASLRRGSRVNLELALRADARLGGHIVQGHVDATAKLLEIRPDGFSRTLSFELPEELARYLVEKGSVALNGVSLTVSALDGEQFSVSLIPETLERTTLGDAAVGEQVNLEVDVLAKYVERLISVRA